MDNCDIVFKVPVFFLHNSTPHYAIIWNYITCKIDPFLSRTITISSSLLLLAKNMLSLSHIEKKNSSLESTATLTIKFLSLHSFKNSLKVGSKLTTSNPYLYFLSWIHSHLYHIITLSFIKIISYLCFIKLNGQSLYMSALTEKWNWTC